MDNHVIQDTVDYKIKKVKNRLYYKKHREKILQYYHTVVKHRNKQVQKDSKASFKIKTYKKITLIF